MTAPTGLLARWRAEAEMFRRRGQHPPADLLESCAAELEEYNRASELEALSLEQAATESGYSYSALQKMLAEGDLPNAGKKGKPLVRRGDLPRKARPRPSPDIAGAVIAGRIGAPLDRRVHASHDA